MLLGCPKVLVVEEGMAGMLGSTLILVVVGLAKGMMEVLGCSMVLVVAVLERGVREALAMG